MAVSTTCTESLQAAARPTHKQAWTTVCPSMMPARHTTRRCNNSLCPRYTSLPRARHTVPLRDTYESNAACAASKASKTMFCSANGSSAACTLWHRSPRAAGTDGTPQPDSN